MRPSLRGQYLGPSSSRGRCAVAPLSRSSLTRNTRCFDQGKLSKGSNSEAAGGAAGTAELATGSAAIVQCVADARDKETGRRHRAVVCVGGRCVLVLLVQGKAEDSTCERTTRITAGRPVLCGTTAPAAEAFAAGRRQRRVLLQGLAPLLDWPGLPVCAEQRRHHRLPFSAVCLHPPLPAFRFS